MDRLLTKEKVWYKATIPKGDRPRDPHQYNGSIGTIVQIAFLLICLHQRKSLNHGNFFFFHLGAMRKYTIWATSFFPEADIKDIRGPPEVPRHSQNHQKLAQFLKVHPPISPDITWIHRWMSNYTSKKRTGLSEQKDTTEILLGVLKRKWVQPSALVSLTHLLFMARRLNYSSL